MGGSARRIAGNILSMFTNDAVNRATVFFLYALVARQLGATEFGQMSLALTIFYIFQVFAIAGLRTLITRDVANDRSRTDPYLLSGISIVTVSSVISVACLLLFVRLMGYSPDTSRVILLLALGLFPFSVSTVLESIFQAWEKMHFIAYSNITVNVARVFLAFAVMEIGWGLDGLILMLLASYFAVALLETLFLLKSITRPAISLDLGFTWSIARSAATFLGIDGIVAIMTSMNVLLLSKLAGEREVGLYSSASQLMVPMTLFYQSMALSIFPIMCRRFDRSFQGMRAISESLLLLLLSVALPSMVGLYFVADSALLTLYGAKGFGSAGPALRVMVWSLLFTALTVALGQVLLASLRERVTLRIVVVDALLGMVLGIVLIGQFGLMGAAVTSVTVRLADFLQHYLAVSRLMPSISWGRIFWRPVTATAVMGGYLWLIRGQELFTTVTTASLLYGLVLAALLVWTGGGVGQVRAGLLSLRSRAG